MGRTSDDDTPRRIKRTECEKHSADLLPKPSHPGADLTIASNAAATPNGAGLSEAAS